MASYLAIAAVAKTVLKLIEDACPRDEFTGTPSFVLFAGPDFSTVPVSEGFSLLVFRVGVNATLRTQQPRRRADGLKRRPALPVDLALMVTPWAAEAERQLRLLGWVMRFLEDNTILTASVLNQSLSRRELAVFDAQETVEIYADAPSLPDYLGLWDKFRQRWQTSAIYGVRTLMIESEIVVGEGALVETREMRAGTPDWGDPA
jgi:hypothetical protein